MSPVHRLLGRTPPPTSRHPGTGTVIGAVAISLTLAGCGGSEPLAAPPSTSPEALPTHPAEQLHGLVAAAQDMRYTATYRLATKGRPDRTVRVQLAVDGSWRFDVPGGAHGGARDVALASTSQGVFQCRLDAARGCVRIAPAGGDIPAAYDPGVHHPFTDWLDVLSDTRAALSVARDTSLPVASGDCFSVEPNAAALTPPMASGIYCFDAEGVLTGARFGTLTLVISDAAGKPRKSVKLPGPVTAARPLSTSPPPPKPSPSPTPSPSKRP